MRISVFDDMGRQVILGNTPQRIVSLVPSDTETLFAIGAGERVVGRTRYCVEPAEAVADIPVVGGTKDIDVDAILDLAPDLVLANQEENSRANLEALAEKGVRTFVSFPKRVADAIAHVARIARILDLRAEARELVRDGYALLNGEVPEPHLRVFVPIWKEPWMSFSEHTYSHDLLAHAGAENVFGDRERKYPLKADLGMRSPLPADQAAHRDRRYPRFSEEELLGKDPDLILLPDEPYEFGDADKEELAALFAKVGKSPRIELTCGKDLFWYGARTGEALGRLRALLSR